MLLSDPLGMLWVSECVRHEDHASYIIILGPVFDAAGSLDTLQTKLRGMNLSVSLTAATVKKLKQVPILPISTLYQYIKMLHWVITEQELDVSRIRLQHREDAPEQEDNAESVWNPDRARMLEKEIMQQIREGNVYGPWSGSDYRRFGRFADKDVYDLGNPLREDKDTAIIFAALSSRAAMDGGLAPRVAKQLEVQYIRAIEQCDDMPALMQVNGAMVDDFIRRVHAGKEGPRLSPAVQECCMYVHSHLLEEIRLEDVAEAVGYTGYYLTKKFRKETGQSLTDYINHARIQYACIQLETTQKPLQEICDELQYCSRSYFTSIFQKEIGCSPTAYRNGCREKREADS